MFAWFVAIALLGLKSIFQSTAILAAIIIRFPRLVELSAAQIALSDLFV